MRGPSVCTEPGCPEIVEGGGGPCPEHAREARRANDAKRPRRERRYGETFERNRKRLLASRPLCALGCGRPATVADHHPRSRRELVAGGVGNPDALEHLRPLCISCHNRETARQPRLERGEPTSPPARERAARYGSPRLG